MGGIGGCGLWVWEADRHDPDRLAAELARHRFGWIAVKAHQGVRRFDRNQALLDDYAAAAGRRRIRFGLWGYLEAADAAGEAELAAELVDETGADFYLANAEGEYERTSAPVSKRFASTFRRRQPKLPAGLSSFGRIDLHPGIKWVAWRDHGFEFHPQAYFCESPQLTPRLCIEAAARVWPLRAIRPTLGAYRGAAGEPTAEELAASLSGLATRGFSVWRAGTASRAALRALGRVRTAPPDERRFDPPALERVVRRGLSGRLDSDGEPGEDAPPAVVWTSGGHEVLVHLDSVAVTTRDGSLEVSVDLENDQAGRAAVSATFALAGPDEPPDLISLAEDLPSGDHALVLRWGTALQEAIWGAIAALAADGAGVRAAADGLEVVPAGPEPPPS